LRLLPPSLPIAIGTSPRGEGDYHFPLGGNKKGGKRPGWKFLKINVIKIDLPDVLQIILIIEILFKSIIL
jgi:hypothetical protein